MVHEKRSVQPSTLRIWLLITSLSADKKELLTKARYDALAASGGSHAVKRAIERKQKKISQRQKKSRPFALQLGEERGSGGKRHQVSSTREDGPSRKRPRLLH
jgi:ribosomal RNA-processing protein 36